MAAFAEIELKTVKIPVGVRFIRLMEVRYRDPMGSNPGGSRFSDPRLGLIPITEVFSVIYLTETIETAIQETILRDSTDRFSGFWPVAKDEVARWHLSIMTTKTDLTLVDLHSIASRRHMGVPTNIVGSSNHSESRQFSLGFYQHPERPDGILYKSRFSLDLNIAIYDRVVCGAFDASPLMPLDGFDYEAMFKSLGAVIVEDGHDIETRRKLLKRY